MTPFERTAQETHALQLKTSEQTYDLSSKLTTWLIAGNGAGLVITLNAIISGTRCETSVLQESLTWFFWGLTLAFCAALVTYVTATVLTFLLGRVKQSVDSVATNDFYARELTEQGIDDTAMRSQIDGTVVDLNRHVASLRRYYWAIGVIGVMYLASIACFVVAVGKPIIVRQDALATCVAARK